MAIVISLCLMASLEQGFWLSCAGEETTARLTSVSSGAEDLSDIEISKGLTKPFVAPDIVDEAEVEANGYIGREKEQEKDLYSFVFRNNDGTNTMRVYSHPVKYLSENGEIRDISLELKRKNGGGFVTAEHEIQTSFSEQLSKGISLEYGEVYLQLPKCSYQDRRIQMRKTKRIGVGLRHPRWLEYIIVG